MLFAIRINLIGTGKRRRRRGKMPDIPNIGILLFVLVLVVEAAVLYSWHASAAEAATQVEHRLRKAKHDLEQAQKMQADLVKVQKELNTLSAQVRLFDVMKAEKSGPVDALTYLSFICSPRDPSTWPREQQKQMEAAGWRVSWNAQRAWFHSITQNKWTIKLKGTAMAHEDVAEVQRRLESSPYFRAVKLVYQETDAENDLKEETVQFTIKAALVYLVDPWKWPPPDEPDPAEEDAAKKKEQEELPTLPSAIKAPRDNPAIDEEPAAELPAEKTSGTAAGAVASPEGVPAAPSATPGAAP